MGLFFGRKKVSPEEEAAQQANRKALDAFKVTDALGGRRFENVGAMQFAYDEEARKFVVVAGPMRDFKDREPWVVDFDDVTDVYLDVDEYWTRGKEKNEPRGKGELAPEEYPEVYWRYDFYIVIETGHPYAGTIRYQTNYRTPKTKVEAWSSETSGASGASEEIVYRRGFEMNGVYRGEEIQALADKLDKMLVEEAAEIEMEETLDGLAANQRKEFVCDLHEKMDQGEFDSKYMKKIYHMKGYVERAGRIYDLLMK